MDSRGTADIDATGQHKKHYEKPRLQVYGSVKEMTRAGTTGGDETGNQSSSKKPVVSDPSAKENIVEVGRHPIGIGLYLFNYKPEFRSCGDGRQFGVMADEVEEVLPEAVSMHANGYKMVNYEMLGIR